MSHLRIRHAQDQPGLSAAIEVSCRRRGASLRQQRSGCSGAAILLQDRHLRYMRGDRLVKKKLKKNRKKGFHLLEGHGTAIESLVVILGVDISPNRCHCSSRLAESGAVRACANA